MIYVWMLYHNQEMKLQQKPLHIIGEELKLISNCNEEYLTLDIQAVGGLRQSNKYSITVTFKRHKFWLLSPGKVKKKKTKLAWLN